VQEGTKVALGDIQTERLAGIVRALGDDAIGVACDVTIEDHVAGLVDAAVDSFGQLDVMINNAGIVGAIGPIAQTSAAEWAATLDVLLNGVFHGVKHAARVMVPQGSGSIISMASTAGAMGGLGPHAYTAAKHAMATPMVAMAHLGDPDDIDGTVAELTDTSPLKGRPGLAEDVANAMLWLASDESGYVSGHFLMTDAGFTTGSRPVAPGYAQPKPMMREAGRQGL